MGEGGGSGGLIHRYLVAKRDRFSKFGDGHVIVLLRLLYVLGTGLF